MPRPFPPHPADIAFTECRSGWLVMDSRTEAGLTDVAGYIGADYTYTPLAFAFSTQDAPYAFPSEQDARRAYQRYQWQRGAPLGIEASVRGLSPAVWR